jgi:hypothetical protein
MESRPQFSVGGVHGNGGGYQESYGWRFLASREILGYRCALCQNVPIPDFGVIVVFIDFFCRGFGGPSISSSEISSDTMMHR